MLLFLSFFFFSAFATDWFVFQFLNRSQISELLQNKCYHGTYGNALSISTCPLRIPSALVGSSNDLNYRVCVVERVNDLTLAQQIARAGGQVLYETSSEIIFGYSSVFRPCSDFVDESQGVVSVPLNPYHPQRRNLGLVVGNEPNDLIVAAIGAVSKDGIQSDVESLSEYNTRNSLSPEAREAQKWLSQRFSDYGFSVTSSPFQEGYSDNVVAELIGKKFPDTFVVAGAHYDSRSTDVYSVTQRAPGADDNASGIAALLQLAQVIHSLKYALDYSLRVVAFSGEEQGLLGSRYYAGSLAENNVDVLAMFNADMLGWQLPNTNITLGMKDRYVDPALVKSVIDITALYLPELPVQNSSSCCSDYQSFYENGYPAVGFFQNAGTASNYPAYHTALDVPGNLNWDQSLIETQSFIASILTYANPIQP